MGTRQELGDIVIFLGVTDHPPATLISPAGLGALPGTSGSSRLRPGSGLPTALWHDGKFTDTSPLGGCLAAQHGRYLDTTTRRPDTHLATRHDDHLVTTK